MEPIKAIRPTAIETNDFKVGDQISVQHYTATCQKVTPQGAIFLLDQYLDEAYPMNKKNTNIGGYEASDLRQLLRSREILSIFDDYKDRLGTFENGDTLRIPLRGEIFGDEDAEYFEADDCEQWELMKDRKNRIAFRQNRWEWGWLQNKFNGSATTFCGVYELGSAAGWGASGGFGVRPAFLIV